MTTATAPAAGSLAEDTLAHRRKDGTVICEGHLVAAALNVDGVGTISTLCVGHGMARRE